MQRLSNVWRPAVKPCILIAHNMNTKPNSSLNTPNPASKQKADYKPVLSMQPPRTRHDMLDKHNPHKRIIRKRNSMSESSINNVTLDIESEISPNILKKLKLEKCPCKKSDSNSWKLQCKQCQQQWHSGCVNLKGISKDFVEQLENWMCPNCFVPCNTQPPTTYVCSVCKNNAEVSSALESNAAQNFINSVKSLSTMSDQLNQNSSDIEYFNLHLKHLLIDASSIDNHSCKLQAATDSMNSISDEICKLNNAVAALKLPSKSQLSMNDEIIKKLNDTIESKITQFTDKIKIEANSHPERDSQDLVNNIQQLTKTIEKQQKDIEKLETSVKSDISTLKTTMDRINQNVTTADDTDSDESRLNLTSNSNMIPNTVSPHLTIADPPCEPYIKYAQNVVSTDIKEKLLKLLQDKSDDFRTLGERDVLYYGEYDYWYSGIHHKACREPELIQELFDTVREYKSGTSWINSCLITRYNTGKNIIPPHRDNEPVIDPTSDIVTVSLGAKRVVKFTSNNNMTEKELEVDDCSVYTMSRYSQDFWQHGIDEDESQETRYSFTFRHIAPHFANSTVLIGDSNTRYAQFGRERGKFGEWLPGKRIEALHIEDIPNPEEVGPYRNYVIHTGINNIKDHRRKSNKTLVKELEQKCLDIQKVYPRSKVYISLLLPTKINSLNRTVSEFNNYILDMTYSHRNLYVYEHSIFFNDSGCLKDKFGRFKDGRPNPLDAIHLGSNGIRLFCYELKRMLIKQSGSYISKSRFNGGNGKFNDVMKRDRRNSSAASDSGGRFDGYQSP